MVRIRKSAEERKREIIDAVIEISADIGPDRLTTERLARKVGISQAGIFRHFATKADIWEAVARRIGQLMRESGINEIDEIANPVDKMRANVIAHLGFIAATPAIPAILFSRELHSENEKLRAFFAGLMAARQRTFAKLFSAEVEVGNFDKALDPDDAALLVLGLIQGLAMRWSLNAQRFDLVKEGSRLLELQLAGFKKVGGK